jgi:hypothetical protein
MQQIENNNDESNIKYIPITPNVYDNNLFPPYAFVLGSVASSPLPTFKPAVEDNIEIKIRLDDID